MGSYFKNEHGQDVGLCPRCKEIKPKSHLVPLRSLQFTVCYKCQRLESCKKQLEGQAIRAILFERAGGCVWPECHMRYPRDFRGNFTLDHINPALKLHKRETAPDWIVFNQQEFWSRVVPNLQVLCTHHNLVKRGQEYGVGGSMHVEPWEDDDEGIPHIDFNEIKLVLPGFEEYANPLT